MLTLTKTLHHIGWIPSATTTLDMILWGGNVVIRRDENVKDIVVRVSNPAGWHINSQNALRQRKDSTQGRTNPNIVSGNGNVNIGGSVVGSIINVGSNLNNVVQSVQGYVRQERASTASSGDTPEAEILVPSGYRGGLAIQAAAKTKLEINVTSWTGGNIKIDIDGEGKLLFGPVAEVETFELETYGQVSSTFSSINAKSVAFTNVAN